MKESKLGDDVENRIIFFAILCQQTDLRVEVLLELQLLFERLDAILTIHSSQHLILQLLSGISQIRVQLKKTNKTPILNYILVQSHAESVNVI